MPDEMSAQDPVNELHSGAGVKCRTSRRVESTKACSLQVRYFGREL